MPAEIAMTPFLQQILQEIDKRAEAESGGDPTRRIQITKALTDQVTRPVLEAAIGRSGQRMGNMAGQQARTLSQTAARQRIGESAMEYDMMNSEANAALTKKSAAWSAGAAMGAGLIGNWPEQAAYEPSKYLAESARVAVPSAVEIPGGPTPQQGAPSPSTKANWGQPPSMSEELLAGAGGVYSPPHVPDGRLGGGPASVEAPPMLRLRKDRNRFHDMAETLRSGGDLTEKELLEWDSLPASVQNFALGGQPDSRLGQLFGGQ